MYSNSMFLDRLLFELSCKQTHIHTRKHTHADTHTHTHTQCVFFEHICVYTVNIPEKLYTSTQVPNKNSMVKILAIVETFFCIY